MSSSLVGDGWQIRAMAQNRQVPTHVAFLRAINLGGDRRASRQELRAIFEARGFQQVETFRASGNVIFAAPADERGLVPVIEQELARAFGFEVLVFLRSADQLRELIRYASVTDVHSTGRRVRRQVALLRSSPPGDARERVLAMATEEDRLAFGNRELLWVSHGEGPRSRLNLRAIEKLIGPWTMRTMDTVEHITSRYFS